MGGAQEASLVLHTLMCNVAVLYMVTQFVSPDKERIYKRGGIGFNGVWDEKSKQWPNFGLSKYSQSLICRP
jgi:hypothetical protein